MRIAVYHNLHSGGAKHSTYEIVKWLAARHQVDLYCPSTADADFFDLQESVEENIVFEFKPGRLFHSPLGRLNQLVRWRDLARLEKTQRLIAAEIDQRGYDVAYVQPCQFTQHPSLLSYLQTPSLYHSREPLRRLHEPTIPRPFDWSQGKHSEHPEQRRFFERLDPLPRLYDRRLRQLEVRNARQATVTVTNSFFTREALYRLYGVNAFVVYHGVNSETFRPLGLAGEPFAQAQDRPFDQAQDRPFVLSVGALTPAKGFDFIIESLGLVPKEIRPELVIVSNYQEPRERAYLEALATEKLVRLKMLTMITIDELVHLYNRARATVCAQVLEPFGLVPLESMACGTPVVAIAEGGLRESLTDGQTGLLVNRDPAEFAAAVERLLSDRTLAERLGQQGRADVCERWTWEGTVRQIERYLVRAMQLSVMREKKCTAES